MPHFRHLFPVLLLALVLSAGCGSRNAAMQKPVASSGASSEDIWYQYGGARLAYTAVARPKQLYTGYGAVRDPVLYGQTPAITQEAPKRRSKARSASAAARKPKPAAAAAQARDPNCPPCPPADAAASQNSGMARPTFPAPASVQSAGIPAPQPVSGVPGSASLAPPPPPSPPRAPLPGMPAATPAAPDAPAR